MNNYLNLEDIRPYNKNEAREVMQSMKTEPLFMQLVNFIWPSMTKEEAFKKADKVNNNKDFQLEFMHQAIRVIIERSSSGLTFGGFENLDPTKAYLFIANHRDILLDSAILQILLVENGFNTTEITFGDNLMQGGFVNDFGKLNRMYTVIREGNNKELYEISQKLSNYIRHTLVEKNESVWIAQRNGRTKDGNDMTQNGLLKMLHLSGGENFTESIKQLNIVPLCISYEYEPCDDLKVQETYLSSLLTKYLKTHGEDLNSIVSGIKQQKGRIHMEVGKPIEQELIVIEKTKNENEKIKELVAVIDEQIFNNYKLWPVNYIASDIANKSDEYCTFYTDTEKNNFIAYLKEKTLNLKGEKLTLFNLFIEMYSNPLKAKKMTQKQFL